METIAQKERKENSCFDYNKRILLEGYLLGKTGFLKITSRTELAKIFNCDRKTIYNEIMRGTVELTGEKWRNFYLYNFVNNDL